MGLPSADQGTEFRNQVNDKLMKTFDIKHRLTTAYHPQANGLDERYNQTITNAIAKFAQQCREGWDEKVFEVVYAYNTAVQESTKYTPFEAMFGHMAKLPVDINLGLDYNPDEKLLQYMNSEDSPDKEKETRKLMEENIRSNIQEAPKKTKEILQPKTRSWSMLQGWCNSAEKGFHKEKASWGEVRLSLGESICYNCSSWKRSL